MSAHDSPMSVSADRPACKRCKHPAKYHINFASEGQPQPPGPPEYPRKKNFCRHPIPFGFCACKDYEAESEQAAADRPAQTAIEMLYTKLDEASKMFAMLRQEPYFSTVELDELVSLAGHAKDSANWLRAQRDKAESPAADLPVERGIPKHGKCSGCGAWIQVEPPEPHICTGRPVENSELQKAIAELITTITDPYIEHRQEANASARRQIEELFASIRQQEIEKLRADMEGAVELYEAEISRLRAELITRDEAEALIRYETDPPISGSGSQ